nr:MAG TPA: hypothetical protein [Caudoviricetes sp.]
MPRRDTFWRKNPLPCRSSAVPTPYSACTCWKACLR